LGKDVSAPAAEGGRKGDAPKVQPVPVIAAPVIVRTVPRQLKVIGTAVPYQTVALTARIDSQITDVKFKAGDFVKTGQVMFQLDDRAIKASLAQAQAALQGDEAQISSLQHQYERTQQGLKKGFFSAAERDNAKAALDAKKAAVVADKAAVENLQVQLDYTTIAAPIDGRTGTINYTVGNLVSPSSPQPLVTINQVEPIYVQVSLPQDSFDAIRAAQRQQAPQPDAQSAASQTGTAQASSAQAGDTGAGSDATQTTLAPSMTGVPVFATRTGSNAAIEGRLDYIDNAIDAATGTFAARASFANADDLLWPGMLVNITINLDRGTPTVTVPAASVQHDQAGNTFVYTVAGDKAHKTPVRVERQQEETALIASGLKQDDIVVTDGMMALKEGAPVAVTPAADKKAAATAASPAASPAAGP
jgi:multidrug efflux system membrane fusion protein